MNFSEMSDDELRQFITAPAVEAANERQAAEAVPAKPQYTEGMSGGELFMAGMGKSVHDPFVAGPKEIAKTIWRGGPEDLAQLNSEKVSKGAMDKELMGHWQAQAGNFAGKAGMAIAAPARLAAQVGLSAVDAALSPGQGPVSGTGNLLATRALQGAEAGGASLAVGLPMKAIGHSLGAMTNRFTPEGKEAIRLNEAANRLGVKRNVGSLDQSSGLNAFETNLPGYARTVEGQSKAFQDAARETVQIPSKSGRSYTERSLDGEKVRKAITEAGDNLKGVGNSLWNDLDSFIVQNNVAPVVASNSKVRIGEILHKYTPIGRKGMDLSKNPVLQRIDEYDPDSVTLIKGFMANPKQAPSIPFSDLHQLQAAVGKAMARAEKDAAAPGASMSDRQVRSELRNLYGSLMSDVDSWGTTNPVAKEMFDEARGFWRDVVVPGAITNKVFGKSSKGPYGMNPRGYSEPSQLYSDVVSNPRAMKELNPYMSQNGRDLVDTLSTMPDLSRSLRTNTPHPPAPGMGTLTTMAGMAVGSPLQLMKGAVSHMPGFHGLMQSDAAKKAYFSRNVLQDSPLGRAAYGLAQQPQGQLEEGLRDLRIRAK